MVPTSGTSNLLPYCSIRDINDVPEIKGQYCYAVKNYEDDGFSLLVGVNNGKAYFKFGDYKGNVIDLSKDHKYGKHIQKILYEHMNKVIGLIALVRVKVCQIYFSVTNDEVVIADVRTHYDKFLSPGMIRDVVSKAVGIPGPAILKIDVMSDEVLDELDDCIIKPSYPKVISRGEDIEPLRARI